MKTEQYLGKEVSFIYTDGTMRYVMVEVVGPNYLTGKRTKDGKEEYRTYNIDKMTNLAIVACEPFFKPMMYNLGQSDDNR